MVIYQGAMKHKETLGLSRRNQTSKEARIFREEIRQKKSYYCKQKMEDR